MSAAGAMRATGRLVRPGKSRAQRVVPAHDLCQAALRARGRSAAPAAEGKGQVELGQSRELPLDPQHVLLHNGDRLADRLPSLGAISSAGLV